MDLAHLTINTNDLRTRGHAEVGAEAIAALAPWTKSTANNAAALPGFRVPTLAARAQRGNGWAQLDIWSGPTTQAAQAVLVWTPEAEAKVWPRIIDQSRRMGVIAAQLRKPAGLPWLAVALTPAAALLPRETLMALGDLERCWAWAVLEDRT